MEKVGNKCEEMEDFSTEMETTEKGQMEMIDIKKYSSTNEESICGLYNRLDIARPIDRNHPN